MGDRLGIAGAAGSCFWNNYIFFFFPPPVFRLHHLRRKSSRMCRLFGTDNQLAYLAVLCLGKISTRANTVSGLATEEPGD